MSKPEKRQRSADSRPVQKLKAQPLRLKSTTLIDPRSVSDFLRLSNGKLPSTNSQKKPPKKQNNVKHSTQWQIITLWL